jgi:hypothetical protein
MLSLCSDNTLKVVQRETRYSMRAPDQTLRGLQHHLLFAPSRLPLSRKARKRIECPVETV